MSKVLQEAGPEKDHTVHSIVVESPRDKEQDECVCAMDGKKDLSTTPPPSFSPAGQNIQVATKLIY